MPTPKLTALSHGAGCACKLSPRALREILAALPRNGSEAVLVGPETADDAGVFRLSDELERITAVRTLLAEETRIGMFIGVAVGWELARELETKKGSAN